MSAASSNSTSVTSTADGVARELAQSIASGANLGAALEAAAEGTRSGRIARALRELAERVNRGEPLAQILLQDSPLPPYLSGVMRAGLATGHPAFSIAEWLFVRERAHSHWRNVVAATAYPLATLAGTYVLFLFLTMWIAPDFQNMLRDMGLRLSPATEAVFWFTEHVPTISLVMLGALTGGLLLVRLIGGRVAWSHLVATLPLFGPLWHWGGSSELLRALALLLEHRIPLPQALRLTGEGISDAALARHCQTLAERVEQGMELSRAMQKSAALPQSIFPIVRSGGRAGNVPAALCAAAEMLEARLQTQSSLVMFLAPTVIFFLIVGMALMLVMGFMLPMVSLIQGLT